jgi:CDP-glucose 4,6-dehydratase
MTDRINKEFWQGRRTLVTGHTGFKGSWLCLWLQALGAELKGLALEPPTKPSLFEVAHVAEHMDHSVVDIRDFKELSKLVANFRPEVVIHMAAQPLVRQSYRQPIETYATNVMGTVHVLEAARSCGSVKAIVNVTTDKCYENREWVWGYRENERMGGHDPYSSSKGCAELVSNAYRTSFLEDAGIALATARAGNVIGGGDWAADRLIPDTLRALQVGDPVLIRNPQAIRPWQHVLEPLSGYLMLAERLYIKRNAFAEAWNFGPEDRDARPVKWIVENLCQKWGNGAKWTLKLDISKAIHRLHWMPLWSLEKALERIIEWQRAWLNGKDMRHACHEQISEYGQI